MDHAARDTMEVHPDIILAFGESDEYRSVSVSQVATFFQNFLILSAFCSKNPLQYTTVGSPKYYLHSPHNSRHLTSFTGQSISLIHRFNTHHPSTAESCSIPQKKRFETISLGDKQIVRYPPSYSPRRNASPIFTPPSTH